MMAAMAEGNADRRTGASLVRVDRKAASAQRITSAAISWSSRARSRRLTLRCATLSAVLLAGVSGVRFGIDNSAFLTLLGIVTQSLHSSASSWIFIFRGASKPARAGFIERRGQALILSCAGEERRCLLDDIRQGWIEDRFGDDATCDVVLCFRDGREVTVRVADRAQGQSLLRTAQASPAERVLHFPLRSLAESFRYGGLMGVMGMCLVPMQFSVGLFLLRSRLQDLVHPTAQAELRGLVLSAALVLALAWMMSLSLLAMIRLLRRREVIVGADGVALDGFGTRRFIAHAQVRRVERDPEGVRLQLKDGGSVLLPTLIDSRAPLPVTRGLDALFNPASVQRGFPGAIATAEAYRQDVARREALFHRIRLARRGRGQSRASSVQLAQLDRQRRSLRAWRDDLRALLAIEGSGYRGAAFGSDQLAEVVEDAGASAERRVAAAIALSGNGDAESKRRVRVAVEACVDQDLRAALEHAAEGELEEAELSRVTKPRRGQSA